MIEITVSEVIVHLPFVTQTDTSLSNAFILAKLVPVMQRAEKFDHIHVTSHHFEGRLPSNPSHD
jgi:hypothetical protein